MQVTLIRFVRPLRQTLQNIRAILKLCYFCAILQIITVCAFRITML